MLLLLLLLLFFCAVARKVTDPGFGNGSSSCHWLWPSQKSRNRKDSYMHGPGATRYRAATDRCAVAQFMPLAVAFTEI